MNNWTGSSHYGLAEDTTYDGEGKQYVITIDFAANDEFKIDDSATVWASPEYGYGAVEEGCRELLIAGANDNANIKIKDAGNYTIYFKTSTNTMWIALNPQTNA